MFLTDWAAFDALIDWMGHGLFNLAWWQVLLISPTAHREAETAKAHRG